MMIIIKYLAIICVFILAFSCKSESNKMNTHTDSEVETISIVDTLSLKLNGNKKWIANIETHEGVSKMDSIITSFKNNKVIDYKGLGEALSKQTSYIIKNCSMKGEPHDQLHIVLIPMLDQISILREEDNEDEAKLALDNLEALIIAYFEFFMMFDD